MSDFIRIRSFFCLRKRTSFGGVRHNECVCWRNPETKTTDRTNGNRKWRKFLRCLHLEVKRLTSDI